MPEHKIYQCDFCHKVSEEFMHDAGTVYGQYRHIEFHISLRGREETCFWDMKMCKDCRENLKAMVKDMLYRFVTARERHRAFESLMKAKYPKRKPE